MEINFKVGDTIKVYQKIKEGEKFRTQIFDGIIIAMKKKLGVTAFTVRKISFGIGIEKVFNSLSQFIEKIEVVKTAKVRKAKLYYLRELSGKKARLKETYVYKK